jgi:crotonobetainyl-CoA:carnitine CoA-transferase CaiB-like acyl-CoA transferase
MEQNQYALSGIRVIELGTHVAVPCATRIMADMGAEVIKVEAPYGDGWRYPGPEFGTPAKDDENPFFTIQNSNKHLICINIKTPEGVKVLEKLISGADVFATNVRMHSLKKIGLDYETLSKKYPRLIYCQNTGYGNLGDEAHRPGYDQATFWARSGSTVDWGVPGAEPIRPSLAFGDMATAAQLLTGLLIAIIARDRTGKGTLVSTSLLSCGIWYNSNGIVSAQECYGYKYPEDRTNPINPFTGYYQGKDGEWFTTVAFLSSGGYKELLRKMLPVYGLDDWVAEIDAGTFNRSNREIIARIREIIRTKTCAEWYAIFDANDVTYEPCAHLKDVTKDKQAWANNYLEEVTFQNGNKATLTTVPFQLSAYATKKIKPVGCIGEETRSILKNAGYNEDEINKLIDCGAVKQA